MSDHIGSLLDAYLDGEIPVSKIDAIETHLASCEKCQTEVNKRRQLVALLHEAPPVMIPKPASEFAMEVRSQLQQRPLKNRTFHRVLKLGWQALPVGLLLVIIFINTVSFLSNAAAFLPGVTGELIGNSSWLSINLTFDDPLRIFLGWSGVFQLSDWNWITGIVALVVISLMYISWMAVWWIQYQPAQESRMISKGVS